MVDGPDTLVLDEGASAREREVGGAVPAAVGRGTDSGDVGCCGGGTAVKPYDNAFPVVTVAEIGGGGIFGEIPGERVRRAHGYRVWEGKGGVSYHEYMSPVRPFRVPLRT